MKPISPDARQLDQEQSVTPSFTSTFTSSPAIPTAPTYRAAGVDLDAAAQSSKNIAHLAAQTYSSDVVAGVGGFAGLFSLQNHLVDMQEPILVAGSDGVGTKLLLAQYLQQHRSIGQDLVAMCANDILTQGAKPLFFLDTISVDALRPAEVSEIIDGIAQACAAIGAVLLGGETAQMAGMYAKGMYDVTGCMVGLVDRAHLVGSARRGARSRSLDKRNSQHQNSQNSQDSRDSRDSQDSQDSQDQNQNHQPQHGDAIIGLASSGFHSNGFSLLRRLLSSSISTSSIPQGFIPDPHQLDVLSSLWKCDPAQCLQTLLTPTRLYHPLVMPLLAASARDQQPQKPQIRGLAHITGGGLVGNIPRILPEGLQIKLNTQFADVYPTAHLFRGIQTLGHLSDEEMLHTFNMGIGFVLIVHSDDVDFYLAQLAEQQETAHVIGSVVSI